MNAETLNERLEDVIERRRLARNAFNRMMRNGCLSGNAAQRTDDELAAANEEVRSVRAEIRAARRNLIPS